MNKEVNNFLNGICPKLNGSAQMKFELAYIEAISKYSASQTFVLFQNYFQIIIKLKHSFFD